jgi:hypothetical protein
MDLVIFNGDLFDEQPNIGLAKRWVVASQTFSEQFAESTKDVGRNPPLTGSELSLQGGNIGAQGRDALPVMGQAFSEVPVSR